MQRDTVRVHAYGSAQANVDNASAASFGIAVLKVLEEILPASADAVEKECRELEEDFTVLAHHVSAQAGPGDNVTRAIGRIVRGMQFQDRNTQVIEDAVCILKHYRLMLETLERQSGSAGASVCAMAEKATDAMLASVRLSATRTYMAEALAGVNCRILPEKIASSRVRPDGDAELF